MHPNRPAFCVAALSLLFITAISGANGHEIAGVWLNGDGDGLIELRVINGVLEGSIVGSPDDPAQLKPSRLDEHNPDPALRQRPLRGLTILTGFDLADDGSWREGRIYDPNSGKTYRGTITPVDANTLKLRGYVGISLFGRTDTWRRYASETE